MANSEYMSELTETTQASIQERAKDKDAPGALLLNWLVSGTGLVSPWWSTSRDRQLREFWHKSDHLSGALYALESKMTAIPFRVLARDQSIRKDMLEADRLSESLKSSAELGQGWTTFFGRFVEDLLTQDNGAFAEVIGPGNPNGPIVGAPISVANLDAARCQRTGNPTYPVVYTDSDGKMYRLHTSRVIFMSQMTSPILEMYGVGFCGVSRCLNVAQTLIDLMVYKQEKLGSRPHRSVMITKGQLDPNDVAKAFSQAEASMTNQGLSRYSKTVVIGSSSLPEAGIDMLDLASLPDGFNEETSLVLGMATVALAMGMDARELFPAMGTGATRADAMIQHLKQRGKGPGQILEMTESAFNMKFLPSYLRMEFDFQDDAQDRQAAEISAIRSNARFRDSQTGLVDTRTQREKMMRDGELDRTQYERLELSDGRLADGEPVTNLFYSRDPKYKKYLDFGLDDPLDVNANEAEAVRRMIGEARLEARTTQINTTDNDERWTTTQCLKALDDLEKLYFPPAPVDLQPAQKGPAKGQTPSTPGEKPGSTSNRYNKNDYRVRGTDQRNPKDSQANTLNEPDHTPQYQIESATN